MQQLGPRTYKVKNPAITFFCPLCRTERGMIYTPDLSPKNYAQIAIISVVVMSLFYPLMEVKVFFLAFVVWGIFEAVKKILFRREITCPHCGFDATWYKKDVRIAKRMVKSFWDTQNASQPSASNNTQNQ
ncbi:MAG: hypothetical protein U0T83_09710 [Bacteriovoracaceae bacterium]